MTPSPFPADLAHEPARIGVVGLGYWGPNLIRNLNELEEADVRWICDLDQSRLDTFVRRYPTVRGTRSFEDLIADPELDAVAIATPVSTHYPLALAALQAGKHVFIEKPLAASVAQAEELAAVAAARGLTLMPGHTFLYSPPVNTIRDLISSGELGDIYFISMSRVNLGLHQSDVSVAWDLGPHDFSILRYWLEVTPSHVAATSRSCIFPNIPDVAFINLEYEQGAIAHVELSWLAPSKLRRTTIVGSRKMVVYDDVSNEPVRIFDSGVMVDDPQSFGEFQLSYRTGAIVSPAMRPLEPLQLEMADFCHSIHTGAVPRSSAQLGVEVVRMIEAVDASLDAQRRAGRAAAAGRRSRGLSAAGRAGSVSILKRLVFHRKAFTYPQDLCTTSQRQRPVRTCGESGQLSRKAALSMGGENNRSAVILDRHPLWLDALDRLLANVGFVVVGRATDGDEALALIDAHTPDVFIAGINASSAEQVAVVRKAQQGHADLRCVVVADSAELEAIEAAFAAGASVYCIRTAEEGDFASAIRQAFDAVDLHRGERPRAAAAADDGRAGCGSRSS